ncbi:MAG: ABC transporter ATP-binding protein [Gemmatimonadota bacterium]
MSGVADEGRLLEVQDLTTVFTLDQETVRAVDGVSFEVRRGEAVGLVGESGSGKTVTSLSVLQLLPDAADNGGASAIRLGDRDLLRLSERELRSIRGNEVSMIFQEPMSSLNPLFSVGDQIGEALRLHKGADGSAARSEAIRLLDEVGIPDPGSRVDDYPHQFSGGMRQRVMIAMALAGEPDLLIADEPTTALDVTIQAQILELLSELRRRHDMAVLLITHDLGVVAEVCDRILVMYEGRIVESGPVDQIFGDPQHPYTRRLLGALPSAQGTVTRSESRTVDRSEAPLLSVSDLVVSYPAANGVPFRAVDGISFDVWSGETFGLVGESGSGKSSAARAILRLIDAESGSVTFGGEEVLDFDRPALQDFRRRAQIVFQDPVSSLNPRLSAGAMLHEVLRVHGAAPSERGDRAVELLERVGLGAEHLDRYPHEFSGGQRQRLGIARALSVRPELLVLDEPVSALDVSVQAEVVRLLMELQDDFGYAYVFIAHDLGLVEQICDRVAVMHRGQLVEVGDAGAVYRDPQHPYTRALLSAIPSIPAVGL